MRIAGIIAEYNPFQNGHAWHIQETRRLTDCDYVVACMDGHFTQRGEPALFSKWNRARMALSCGVDAVFELPALFAVRSADTFAQGGVAILGGLGVDDLAFGSEVSEIGIIQTVVRVAENEPKSVSEAIKEGLSRGESHARARGNAVADYLNVSREIMNRPNMILAIEYIRAMHALGFEMNPVAIERRGGYHDDKLDAFASATAIRAALRRGEAKAVLRCIPEAARRHMNMEHLHPMDDLLFYRLRQMTIDNMKELPGISEGLEQRLYRLCRETGTHHDLLEAMKCKRYTHARLSRLLTHSLLGFSREMLEAHPVPDYARLIGLRRGAEPLISELSRRTRIPIVASPQDIRENEIFQMECHATDLWALLHDDSAMRLPGRELTERFVRI